MTLWSCTAFCLKVSLQLYQNISMFIDHHVVMTSLIYAIVHLGQDTNPILLHLTCLYSPIFFDL